MGGCKDYKFYGGKSFQGNSKVKRYYKVSNYMKGIRGGPHTYSILTEANATGATVFQAFAAIGAVNGDMNVATIHIRWYV